MSLYKGSGSCLGSLKDLGGVHSRLQKRPAAQRTVIAVKVWLDSQPPEVSVASNPETVIFWPYLGYS